MIFELSEAIITVIFSPVTVNKMSKTIRGRAIRRFHSANCPLVPSPNKSKRTISPLVDVWFNGPSRACSVSQCSWWHKNANSLALNLVMCATTIRRVLLLALLSPRQSVRYISLLLYFQLQITEVLTVI
jgi:hypothetical protein